jgi:tetratricopeptide (TPR) repeat protein
LLLLLALPAMAGQGDDERVARDVADAYARGDRGRLLLLAAEPASRVDYARVVDALLRGGHADAAEALARERQGPEAEGLARLVQSFKDGRFPDRDGLDALRLAAEDLGNRPEEALNVVDGIHANEGTLFAVDVSRVRAQALQRLERSEEEAAELKRCAALARAVGEWATALAADEARLGLATNGKEALDAAEAFLEAAKRLDDRAAVIRALRARGRVRGVEGELLRRQGSLDEARARWRSAREDYVAAADLAEKENDRRAMGLCWRDIAVIFHEREGQPREALTYYEKALPALREAGTPEEVDGTVFNIALVLTGLARYDEALKRLDEILEPGRAPDLRSRALAQRAYVLGRMGRLATAVAAYRDALDAAPAPGERAALLVQAGDLGLARMDPRAALESYGKALAIAPDDLGALVGQARALGLLGDEEGCRRAFDDALTRVEGKDQLVARGVTLSLLADQLLRFGDLDDALRTAGEEVKVFVDKSLTEYGNAAEAWKKFSDLAFLGKQYDKAAECLANASTIYYKLNRPARAIELYAQEALLQVMLKNARSATERLQVLDRMAETTPDDGLKSLAKSAEAIFEARGGRGAHALELLDEARKLAQAAGDRKREALALVNRALLEPEAAAAHVREALKLLDADRLGGPEVHPLIEGFFPDWGPGIALDGILKSGKEQPEDAFFLIERALSDRLLLSLHGRDQVLVCGLTPEQHARYVAARADLIEARATKAGVAQAEGAFDAMVAALRSECPGIAGLAWPPEPPLVEVQKALREDEALVLLLFDPYVSCALFVDKGHAALRRVAGPSAVLDALKDLLEGKRTLLVAAGPAADAFPGTARLRTFQVPTAAAFLRARTTKRPPGEGFAALGPAPAAFGAPVESLPAHRLAMVYVAKPPGPLEILSRRFDADTVVLEDATGSLPIRATALLAAGAGNVVVAGRPPGPLDIFLDGAIARKLPVAAAFHEASAKGAIFLFGAPE